MATPFSGSVYSTVSYLTRSWRKLLVLGTKYAELDFKHAIAHVLPYRRLSDVT